MMHREPFPTRLLFAFAPGIAWWQWEHSAASMAGSAARACSIAQHGGHGLPSWQVRLAFADVAMRRSARARRLLTPLRIFKTRACILIVL